MNQTTIGKMFETTHYANTPNLYTPRKINIESEKDGLEKDFPLQMGDS